MPLATTDDYVARHGDIEADSIAQIEQLLIDASSLVVQVANQAIVEAVDDEATLDGDGTSRLFLPQFPVTAVTSVEVDDSIYRETFQRVMVAFMREDFQHIGSAATNEDTAIAVNVTP